MKKRIIASTMASVMALSGAASALVASADVADYKNEHVTRGELKKFIEEDKEILALIDGGLEQYGSKSGEKFLKAIDYATAVVEDGKTNSDDATVAYLMVKAAYDALAQHDKIELQALVAECSEAYGTENELNDAGDLIYDEGPWSDFETAYISADDVKDSDDILVTTDAFDELKAAYDTLLKHEKDTKTKREIMAARKAYEQALALEFKYQPWQRGTVKDSGTDYDGESFAWGVLYEHIASGDNDLVDAYQQFEEMKGVAKTSNDKIVEAVDMMDKAAKVLTGFDAKMESGGETQIKALLKKYSNQLVYTYKADEAAAIVNSLAEATQTQDGTGLQFLRPNGRYEDGTPTFDAASKKDYWNVNENSDHIILAAELDVKVKNTSAPKAKDVYYILDKNTKLDNGFNALLGQDADDDGVVDKWFWDDKDAATAFAGSNGTVKTLSVGKPFKLSNYIGASVDEVIAGSVANNEISVTTPTTSKAAVDADLTATATSNAINALRDGLTAVSSAVSGFGGSADGAADLTPAHKTALLGSISTAIDDVNALSDAITDVTGEADPTPAQYQAVADAAAQVKISMKAITDKTYATDLTIVKGQLYDLSANPAVNKAKDVDDLFNADSDFAEHAANYAEDYFDEAMTNIWKANKKDQNDTIEDGAEGSGFGDAFDYKYDGTNKTFDWTDYESSKHPDGSSVTTASLPAAMMLLDGFRAKYWDDITLLDNINTIVDQAGVDRTNSKPKSQAWNILYNYMKYALEDMFEGSKDDSYTLAQIKELIEKSYTLAEETGETAMFNISHVAMVDDRTGAIEWVKLAEDAKKAKSYIENFSKFEVETRAQPKQFNSTQMYKQLKKSYDQLNKEKKAFAYSYGEIIEYMADVAKEIDDGVIKGDAADKLKKDLNDAALKLMTLGDDDAVLEFDPNADAPADDNAAFNEDGTLNKHNRLFTNGKKLEYLATDVTYSNGNFTLVTVKKNDYHTDMKDAFEKLKKDYEEAKAAPVDQVTTDVNGDGSFNVFDVQELLNLFVNSKTEVAKHDINHDGKVNIDDVINLLNQVVNK